MGEIRRSRSSRPARGQYHLTSRDYEILYAIGRMKVATTAQLRTLFFNGGKTTTVRRLAKLFAMKCIATHVLSLNDTAYYTLTARGRDLLDAQHRDGDDVDDLHVVARLDRVDHHLVALNDIRVGLALAARRRPDVEVAFFLADHDLRAHAAREGRTSPGYIPDALVELVVAGGGRQGLVVEYDAGTEHARQFAPKVETLRTLFERGLPVWGLQNWRPVVVAETPARLRTLASVIVAGGGGDLWVAALQARLVADPFGPVFATAASVAATPPALTPAFGGRLVPRPGEVR